MSVALVATFHLTKIWLVRCVYMHMLFAIGAVGEATIAAIELTLERLFT